MNILDYMNANPLIALVACTLLILLIRSIVRRIINAITISIRGWPPPHLDADGDYHKEEEE